MYIPKIYDRNCENHPGGTDRVSAIFPQSYPTVILESKYREENWRFKSSIKLLDRVGKLKKLKKSDKSKVMAFMSQEKLRMGSTLDAKEATSRCNEKILVYAKKIEMHENRKVFSRQNTSFELYRRRFYKSLESTEVVKHQVAATKIKEFWETMWTKRNDQSSWSNLENLVKHLLKYESLNVFPTFQKAVKWKAARPNRIFNFFIKKYESLHQHLYEAIRKICLENHTEEEWFYKGITYLIPKGVPTKGSDFRPITLMSSYIIFWNVFKQAIVKNRDLLAENQLGTVRMVQGAKEQALLNLAINKEYSNRLKTAWIDVKKALDNSYILD
jgi:hypothetical protein